MKEEKKYTKKQVRDYIESVRFRPNPSNMEQHISDAKRIFGNDLFEDIPKKTLSDKSVNPHYNNLRMYLEDDVKDFIKTIKNRIICYGCNHNVLVTGEIIKIIDEESGEELR